MCVSLHVVCGVVLSTQHAVANQSTGSALMAALSEHRRVLVEMQSSADPVLQAHLTNELKQRISRAFNGLRLLALNARSPAKP